MHAARNETKKTFTFLQNCQAGLVLKWTPCGKFLKIIELIHPLSQELFQSLPQQRLKNLNKLRLTSTAALQAHANQKAMNLVAS